MVTSQDCQKIFYELKICCSIDSRRYQVGWPSLIFFNVFK